LHVNEKSTSIRAMTKPTGRNAGLRHAGIISAVVGGFTAGLLALCAGSGWLSLALFGITIGWIIMRGIRQGRAE
jgi:hypothetical protein